METILIIDDSSYIVDGLVALLKRKGYTTMACSGGEEAIALLASTRPDLILLDIMMEPMDGWETLAAIKANPATTAIPILMFSAKKITPEEAEEHSLNIEDFVSKPVNPAQLLAAIARIFERRDALRDEARWAMDHGIDSALVEECAALRKGIDVDKNLLLVLKRSTGSLIPGKEVHADDIAAIGRLEEKIRAGEERLAELTRQIRPVRPE